MRTDKSGARSERKEAIKASRELRNLRKNKRKQWVSKD